MIYEAQKDKEVFDVITPIYKLNSTKIHNPNVVKVLLNYNNRVLYFSRSAIPYLRDYEKKIGVKTLFIGDMLEFMDIEQLF